MYEADALCLADSEKANHLDVHETYFVQVQRYPRSAPGLNLDVIIQSVNLSSRRELLCYFIYPLGIERNMPPNLYNSRKRILV